MATNIFLLPDLGEGLTEAVIVRWMVKVGDVLALDQAIAEVETAKSIVELPSPFAGSVVALHGEEGATIATGSPILEVSDGDSATSNANPDESQNSASGSERAASDSTEMDAYRAEERAGSGSGNVLIGYGTGSVGSRGRRTRKSVASAHREASAPPVTGPVAVRSPIVRRLAKQLGVDTRTVKATGIDGVITRSDVLKASAGQQPRVTEPVPVAGGPETGEETSLPGLHGLTVSSSAPMTPLRKAVAAKMSKSRAEIPEATVWVDVDFTELWNLRPQLVGVDERPPSLTSLVARFVLLALDEYPLLASRLSENGDTLTCFNGVNLGVAVDSERGLSVPVLPQAGRLSLAQLDIALRELSAEARTGRLAPAKLTGSTFTFNNYGGFGVDGSAAVINHPEVAILGMGRVIERPWVVRGEIVARRIAQLSLAFDHRVCDGGYAAGFISRVVEQIEHPLRGFVRI